MDTAPKMGGGQTSLLSLLACLDRHRFNPLVATPPGSGLEHLLCELGIPTLPLPLASRTSRRTGCAAGRYRGPIREPWRLLVSLVKARGWCNNHRVELLHANTTKGAVLAALVGSSTGVPVIAHHRLEERGGTLARWAFARASRVIGVSQAAADTAELPPGKTRVVHDGVDPQRFRPRVESDTGPVTSSGRTLTVAVVGRLSPDKGQDLFLRAARIVAREEPRARFLLAGETFLPGDDLFERELHELASVAELQGRVHFLGFHPDVSLLLSRVDLLVAPSRRESLGISVLEAMSSGLPVVAARRGGLQETIRNGVTGLLVPPEDPGALAHAIVSLLGDPERRGEMGRNGRRRVIDEFSQQAMTRRVEEIYDELVSPGRERPATDKSP